MSFVQLMFLFGALAVVGPLAAHLLAKPRFRRVPFTMLRFLRFGQVESQSRRRFRDLLILLLRCAIIILIAMLFARPRLLIKASTEKPKHVYFLGLDNSISMAYSEDSKNYFEDMVDSAVDYIGSADADGVFNICSLASQNWVYGLSKEQALVEVKGVKIVPAGATIAEFLSAVSDSRKEHSTDAVSAFIVSDFTPNMARQFADVVEPIVVDAVDYRAVVSDEPINNAAIVDAHATGFAADKLTVNVAVINYGPVEQSRQLTARIGKNESAPVDVKLASHQRKTCPVQIAFDTTDQAQSFLPVELSLSSGDGLKADDTFYLAVSIPQRQSINVLLVGADQQETFLLKTAMDALSRTNSNDALSVKRISYEDFDITDLRWAKVVYCSTITSELGDMANELKNFVSAGGKIVLFVNDNFRSKAAKQLWQGGILPALPKKYIRKRAHIQPIPERGEGFVEAGAGRTTASRSVYSFLDTLAARSLSNYKIDRIVLKGYFECQQHPESVCAWRLQNGFGFVYLKYVGKGGAIFVNTSSDDSLGALTKSSASIAFCRYLLGPSAQINEHNFVCTEQIILPASEMEAQFAKQKRFWVVTCNGKQRQVTVVNSLGSSGVQPVAGSGPFLLVPDAEGVGWVKTLTKPTRYAGVNLPLGETDMTGPSSQQLAGMINQVFSTVPKQSVASAKTFAVKEYKSIWKIFVWVIIALLVAEAAVANRMRR